MVLNLILTDRDMDVRLSIASIACFVVAFSLFCTSSGLISSALASSGNWNEIQGNVTGYVTYMALGAALLAVGCMFFMMYSSEYSYMILAGLTALAFGISSTALAAASVSIQ